MLIWNTLDSRIGSKESEALLGFEFSELLAFVVRFGMAWLFLASCYIWPHRSRFCLCKACVYFTILRYDARYSIKNWLTFHLILCLERATRLRVFAQLMISLFWCLFCCFFSPLPKKNGETTKYTNNNNALFGTAVIINTHREKERMGWKKSEKNEHSYNKNHAILWPASSVLLIWKFLQFRCLHRFLPSNQRRLIEKSRWTSVI